MRLQISDHARRAPCAPSSLGVPHVSALLQERHAPTLPIPHQASASTARRRTDDTNSRHSTDRLPCDAGRRAHACPRHRRAPARARAPCPSRPLHPTTAPARPGSGRRAAAALQSNLRRLAGPILLPTVIQDADDIRTDGQPVACGNPLYAKLTECRSLASICALIGPMSRPMSVGARPWLCTSLACWNVCSARRKDARAAAGLAGDNLDGWLGAARLCLCALRHVETPPRSDCEPKSARPKIARAHNARQHAPPVSDNGSRALPQTRRTLPEPLDRQRATASLARKRSIRVKQLHTGQPHVHIGDSHKTYYGIFYCGRIFVKMQRVTAGAATAVEPAAGFGASLGSPRSIGRAGEPPASRL